MKKMEWNFSLLMRHGWIILLLCSVLFACSKNGSGTGNTPPPDPVPPVPPATFRFDIKDTKIVDNTGAEFIAKGVNVNGPGWPWSRATIPDVNLITDTWKCNIVRLNCWPQNPPYNNPSNTDLDAIVTAFTNKKVVVLIEDHSFTGVYPNGSQLTTAVSFWTALATKYKANPYVWFNLMNEPGGGGAVPATWLDVHDAIAKAIRNTGAENIIVCDEHAFGQANGYDNATSSAALTYGETLTSRYKNIAFSLHLYDRWIYGKDRLDTYTTAVKAKKLALIIGEYGVGPDYSAAVATDIFKVVIPKKIGRIAWHWVGEDTYKLVTTPPGGGFSIDNTSGTKPTNLSFSGNLVWLDNHNQLALGDAALTPPAVLVANPDFENGTPANNSNDIKGWINFGTARLDNDVANVKQGSFSVRINAAGTGGCGQGIYLQPGANYKITCWGKNSLVAGSPSSLGIKSKTSTGGVETTLASLDFTENTWQEKTATFSTPATLAEVFLFIFKNDVAPAFWCDNIRVEKL